MKAHKLLLFSTVLAAALIGTASAQHDHHHDGDIKDDQALGSVTFQPACKQAAADQFDRGLALMHHMMYQQARSTFRAITESAPECAMGHWGVAATYFQPLWPQRPDAETLAQGRKHLRQARAAGPGDSRETALISAVDAYFEDSEAMRYGDRIQAWAEGMADAYQAHPEDLDIGALYGLSRLSLAMTAEDAARDRLHDDAEAVLRRVWEAEATHPGAIHYSIHATDVDGRAENALDMVAAYADIAPNVPHALHMPSHIHVRLGDWDEVIAWNRRSADAARNHRINGALSFHFIHAIDYLVYGYLQQGKIDEAEGARAEAETIGRHQPVFASAFHAAAIPARIAVEQRDWEAARALPVREPDDLPWDSAFWPEGLSWFARGLGAARTGDQELAEQAQRRLASLRDQASEADEDRFATYMEVDRRILEGWTRHAQGDQERALALMKSAAELETTVEKDPVTPGALYPPREALGDLLLALDRPAEALAAYQAADQIWPGRLNTLEGMRRARQQLGSR